jgi:hypothetical protein
MTQVPGGFDPRWSVPGLPPREDGALDFDLDARPRYRGPLPPGVGSLPVPEPECCENPACEKRPYHQAVVLLMDRLTQSYAALQYLGWATAGLWRCDHDGHPIDCPDPGCTFGRDQIDALEAVEAQFCRTVKGLFAAVTRMPVDLTAEWQGFYDVEQAREGRKVLGRTAEAGVVPTEEAARMIMMYLEVWRVEATRDASDYRDWLPTVGPPGGPPDDGGAGS